MNKFKIKKFWLSVTTIIAGFSLGLCILCAGRCLLPLIIVLIASLISIYLKKSISKEEQEKQEEISTKAFIAGILIPISLILLLLIAVVVRAIWKTYT
jgi:membrane protein implicated in regulation of membrane protease activity